MAGGEKTKEKAKKKKAKAAVGAAAAAPPVDDKPLRVRAFPAPPLPTPP